MNDRIKTLIKIIVTVAMVFLVVKNIKDRPEFHDLNFGQRLLSADFKWMTIAFVALLLSMILGALQWFVLLRAQQVNITFPQALRYFFVGLFFNNFMLGNVGGDVKRVYDINKNHDSLGGGFTATLFDRLFGLFFLNGLALGVGILFFLQDTELGFLILPAVWIFLGFLFILIALFSRRFGAFIESLAYKVSPKLAKAFSSIRNHFHRYRQLKLWLMILPLSAVIQILRVSVHYFVATSMGIDLSISYFLYFIPLVAVVSALPISIGGFGPREALAQFLFARVGVSMLDSVIMQLLAYGVNLLVSLVGAFHFVIHRKDKLVSKS